MPIPATGAVEDHGTPAKPVSLGELFLGFLEMGLSGFGGVLPWARRVIVERRQWLGPDDFNGVLGLCQILPGPNVVNLSVVVGSRFQGARGAIVASVGLLAAPFVIVVLLGMAYARFGELPGVQAMLRGMSAVAVGLTIATGLKMAWALRQRFFAVLVAAATFAAIAIGRLPLPLVLLVIIPLSLAQSAVRKP